MTTRPSGTAPGQRHLNGIQTTGREFRNLTEPAYQVSQANDVPAPMRDGVELMTDIYRPDAGGRVPALLAYSCYPRQMQNLRAPAGVIEAGASDFFVPRGYAHVIANARSTSGSGGTWGMLDSAERDDLYDLIEWVAAQPWCDGNVGMLGISYFAMAQIAAAASRPPHLKAIFALGTNESVFDVIWHHGLLSSGFFSTWISAVGILGGKSSTFWRSKALELAGQVFSNSRVHAKLAHVNGEAAVTMLKSVLRSHYPDEPFGRIWQQACVEHPTYDAFWADRDCTVALADVDIPVYLGCDWDNVVMHLPGTFTSWKALARNPSVRMGLLPEGGLNWPWESMHYEALAWYDHWLKGIDTGILGEPPVRVYVRNGEGYRDEPAWPLKRAEVRKLYLAPGPSGGAESINDGRLVWDAPSGKIDPTIYTYPDPAWTFPGLGSAVRGNSGLPHDTRRIMTFCTDAFDQDLEVTGPSVLHLWAASSAEETQFILRVMDVPSLTPELQQAISTLDIAPPAQMVTEGWLKASHRELDPELSGELTPHHTHAHPEPLVPGEIYQFAVEIWPTSWVFRAGHRLRLDIMTLDQSGLHYFGQLNGTDTFFHDQLRPSHLSLPVITSPSPL